MPGSTSKSDTWDRRANRIPEAQSGVRKPVFAARQTLLALFGRENRSARHAHGFGIGADGGKRLRADRRFSERSRRSLANHSGHRPGTGPCDQRRLRRPLRRSRLDRGGSGLSALLEQTVRRRLAVDAGSLQRRSARGAGSHRSQQATATVRRLSSERPTPFALDGPTGFSRRPANLYLADYRAGFSGHGHSSLGGICRRATGSAATIALLAAEASQRDTELRAPDIGPVANRRQSRSVWPATSVHP